MNNLLLKALSEVPNLQSGEKFLVRDLFKGYEWNRLSLNERRNLGRYFFEASNNIYLQNGDIIPLAKNNANQQVYLKN